MKERLKEIRIALNMSRREFADRMNLSVSSVESYEYGRRIPSDAQIELICRKANISEHWLRTGEGEMYAVKTVEDALGDLFDAVAHDQPDAFRKRVFLGLATLDPTDWETVERILNKVLGQNEKPG